VVIVNLIITIVCSFSSLTFSAAAARSSGVIMCAACWIRLNSVHWSIVLAPDGSLRGILQNIVTKHQSSYPRASSVFTRTWLRYVRVFAIAIPSVVCLFVVCL